MSAPSPPDRLWFLMQVECLLLYPQHLVQCLAARKRSINSWQMWLATSKVAGSQLSPPPSIHSLWSFSFILRIWQCWRYAKLPKSVTFILLVTFSTYMLWQSKLPCQKGTERGLRKSRGPLFNDLQGNESYQQPHELGSRCFPVILRWNQSLGQLFGYTLGEPLMQRTQLSQGQTFDHQKQRDGKCV